jgi:hypothetical protein
VRPRPSWQLKWRHQLGCIGVGSPSCDDRSDRAWALPGTLGLGEGYTLQSSQGVMALEASSSWAAWEWWPTRGGEDAGSEEQG